MELRKKPLLLRFFLVAVLLIFASIGLQAQWSGPILIRTLDWGANPGQIGWSPSFMGDAYPDSLAVDSAGKIVVDDSVNFRILVLSANGSLENTIQIPLQERNMIGENPDEDSWPADLVLNSGARRILVTSPYTTYVTVYDYNGSETGHFVNPFYGKPGVVIFGTSQGFVLVHTVWRRAPEYYTCDANGENLEKRTERPPEIGICSGSEADTTITFPNHVLHGAAFYGYCRSPWPYILADNGDFLTTSNYGTDFSRYSPDGELLGHIELPAEQVLAWDANHEYPTSYISYYGEYDPHGNIYVTKAVRKGDVMEPLQILKWTWTGNKSGSSQSSKSKSTPKPAAGATAKTPAKPAAKPTAGATAKASAKSTPKPAPSVKPSTKAGTGDLKQPAEQKPEATAKPPAEEGKKATPKVVQKEQKKDEGK